jgi:enamine deaminase RidA (YjgF/YER057c/UK114 family)
MIQLFSKISRFAFACHKPAQLQLLFPQGLPAAVGPYSPVTVFGNAVYVSGQIPLNPETGNVEAQTI